MSKRCHVSDLMGPITKRTIDGLTGYMTAPGNLSRAGNVQEYSARELGLDVDGVEANRKIRMYRPPSEVFEPAALKSFEGKPITLSHPPTNVTADNYREYNVGHVSDVATSGEYMTGTLHIRDKAAVDAVIDGTSQLSCGYSFDADMTPGTTADGQAYDGVMRGIIGNHQAIVDAARAGPGCRVADSRTTHLSGERTMAIRKLTIDKIPLELEDNQASLVEKIVGDAKAALQAAIDGRTLAETKLTAAETALAEERAKGIKLASDHATALAAETAKILKPEQIEAMAIERTKVVADAVVLVPAFKAAGKAVPAIRAEVLGELVAKDEALKPIVLAVLGGAELAQAGEGVVRAAFDAARAAKKTTQADARGSVNDPAVAAALVSDASRARAAGARKQLSGYDLLRYRENHGGKNPPSSASA